MPERPAVGHEPEPDLATRVWRAPWLWLVLVIVLFCVPLFVGLGERDYENDESMYSFAVDAMLDNGDWLTPRLIPDEASPFLEKPPLKYWIVALPIHWGWLPQNEFGMRFWDAVMSSLAFVFVFLIGRRLAGPICGLVAVMLLFVHHPLIFQHGLRTNDMEAAVFLAYAAGAYCFLAWRSAPPDTHRHIFAAALAFVLGFMTKYVAALFLPVIWVATALLKRWDRLRLRLDWLAFLAAGLLAAGLIAPWFVAEQRLYPDTFLPTILGEHVVKRFTTSLDPNHIHPWSFYLTELWGQLVCNGTAVLTIAGALLIVLRIPRHRWVDGALVVVWFVIPVTAISFGTSKLYHYLYPFLPPVALAGGYAAAFVTARAWRWLVGPARELAAERDALLPHALTTTPAKVLLTGIGLMAAALAVGTAVLGHVQVAVGGDVLVRNTNVLLPAAVAVLALVAGAGAWTWRGLISVSVFAAVLPWPAYAGALSETRAADHPLRDLRTCLSLVISEQSMRPPGVWVEAPGISHVFSYYLRSLGPWQPRDVASDATVAMHLFWPPAFRPVLLSNERRDEFMAHLSVDAPDVLSRAAGKAGVDVLELAARFNETELGVFDYAAGTLLLPGPFRGCSSQQLRPAGR